MLQMLLVFIAFLLVLVQDDDGDAENAFSDNVASNVAKASTLPRYIARAAIRNVDFIFSWVY